MEFLHGGNKYHAHDAFRFGRYEITIHSPLLFEESGMKPTNVQIFVEDTVGHTRMLFEGEEAAAIEALIEKIKYDEKSIERLTMLLAYHFESE